jgi:hypothetical protein
MVLSTSDINTMCYYHKLDMQKSQSHEVVDTRWVELLIDGEKIHHRTNHAAAIDNSVMYVYGGYDIELGILGDFYRIALNA